MAQRTETGPGDEWVGRDLAMSGGGGGLARSGPAAAVAAAVRYPASLGQQRFWVLDRLDPGNPALNIAVRWRLEGDVRSSEIEHAFGVIVARHASLRTCLVEAGGEPIQLVCPAAAVPFCSIDLTVLAEADAVAECERIARAEAQAPFDLAVAPLIRVTHVRLRAELAILLVTTHHVVCDGWSIGLLAREMGEICRALRTGAAPVLPELAIGYGEFSEWQREVVGSGGAADVAFWSRTLEGAEYFELPADFRQSPAPGSSGAIHSVLLNRAMSDRFAAMARDHGCTMFMTAVAALTTVLHRYTGATDIAIGTQVAGRSDIETENLVGLFINTLVLRSDLSGNPRFSDLLRRVRRAVSDALDHDTMPLEKVIESLKPKRYPGHNAIFSINFLFQRSFIANAGYGQFRLVDVPSYSPGAMHDLNFFMVERPEGWRISCEYNVGRYEQATVCQLVRHMVNVVAAVAARPECRLADLPMLDEAERRHLVVECNRTAAAHPGGDTLPLLFELQAARTPDGIAVVDGDDVLSYAEIERRSRVLALDLLGRGFAPGARVGVFVRRSADLVIAPLAIMRAGYAFVPLDPAYPVLRLRQIAEQAELSAIVVGSEDRPEPWPWTKPRSGDFGLPFVKCGSGGAAPSGVAGAEPLALLDPVLPEQTAYVIFTSGSTGVPKGVQVGHRALSNFMHAMRAAPGITERDRLLAVTTVCFDIAILELFLPLTVGGRVVVANEDETRDGRLLLDRVRRGGVTVLQGTPTTWRLLLEAGWHGDPPLRMLCGGEPLPPSLAEQLLACSPELWNMYGPTETTIWSSVTRVVAGGTEVALGPPIANTRFFAVDGTGQIVPQGAIGELLIGGDGVASGYWGMAEATAERFIPDRFGDGPGRLYRTGDLVRMRRDGRWQFLGRSDNQLKIRGFRIELAEIEAALLGHREVRAAVAATAKGAGGEPAIIGYVELAADGTRREQILGELRELVVRSLPTYMRPAAIVGLDTLPVLPNGKIDRRSLPRPVDGQDGQSDGEQPWSELETRLKEIWCSVLGLASIDRSADFFDLGGHSLLATRLLARVEAVFGRRISLAALFNSPSFVGFASLLRSPKERDFDFRQVVRLQPGAGKPGIFAVNNTGIYLTLSRLLGEDLPVTALQLFDPLFPRDVLPGSIEEIAGQYVELVRRLQPEGPYTFLGWCNGGVLAFEIARQLQDAGQVVSRVIVVDTWLPGYIRRLRGLRSVLADYSYRWKLVTADWADMRAGRKKLSEFISYRRTILKLFRRNAPSEFGAEPEYAEAERFDRWLVEYLDRMLQSYQPRAFAGRMMVFRSSREPAGRFLDPKLGWDGFALGGVDVATVPGDHFSVFKEPGISVIAQRIGADVARDAAERAAVLG